MIYCFDLDDTLCKTLSANYKESIPIMHRINKVNELYDEGHIIIIDTARGATTGIDWFDITKAQLKEWGVKHHRLRVGEKFHYDIIIDDKAINDKIFFKQLDKDNDLCK